jgi:ribosome-associated heat shock protein Hsp15
LSAGNLAPAPASRRLDQWLWFARLVKSRSLGTRLCAAGVVMVNGGSVMKPNHAIKIGDTVAVSQRALCRRVRVLALGARRGPATEARSLYEEIGVPVRLAEFATAWTPLLED